MAETELERAQKRYDQARARLQALRNREAARERKIDTRRKVILGGALMDLATRDSNAAAMLDRLLHHATTVVTNGQSYRMLQARQRRGGEHPTQ
mgnify:CR=1 FL=1